MLALRSAQLLKDAGEQTPRPFPPSHAAWAAGYVFRCVRSRSSTARPHASPVPNLAWSHIRRVCTACMCALPSTTTRRLFGCRRPSETLRMRNIVISTLVPSVMCRFSLDAFEPSDFCGRVSCGQSAGHAHMSELVGVRCRRVVLLFNCMRSVILW